MTLYRFYFDSKLRADIKNETFGEACLIHLSEVRPDLAAVVTNNPDMNPSGCNDGKTLIFDKFAAFIESQWYVLPVFPTA